MPEQTEATMLATWDAHSATWRAPDSLLCEHLALFSGTWPSWGMTQGGVAFELLTPGRHTDGSASSLLPTPVADHSRGLPQPGTDYQSLPNVAATLMPTPTAQDHCGSRNSTANRSPDAKAASIGDTLTDWAWKHDGWTGATTQPPSTDGNAPSDE